MELIQWDPAKNIKIQETRGISFEQILYAIEKDDLLDILEHPNPSKYKDQLLLIVKIDQYAVVVPAIKTPNGFFLKTAFQSRKMTKRYLGDE